MLLSLSSHGSFVSGTLQISLMYNKSISEFFSAFCSGPRKSNPINLIWCFNICTYVYYICVQENAVLMRTGVRFYGARDAWILGCKIGLPRECRRGEKMASPESTCLLVSFDFLFLRSFAVMILSVLCNSM